MREKVAPKLRDREGQHVRRRASQALGEVGTAPGIVTMEAANEEVRVLSAKANYLSLLA